MENYCILIGDILSEIETRSLYRVLFVNSEYAVLCTVNITKLDIRTYAVSQLINKLIDESIIKLPTENHVYDYDKLTEKQKKAYDRKKDIMDKISNAFGPDYLSLMSKEPKPVIAEILSEGHIGKTALWDNIRKYLQSGFNIYELINVHSSASHGGYGAYTYKKKPGRHSQDGLNLGIPLTDKVIMHFTEALNQYKKGRYMTYEKAYLWMLNKYYSYQEHTNDGIILHLLAVSERPTFDQFYYFSRKTLSAKERDIIKTSPMEVRNNNRLLLSDVMHDVMGPCDRVQMDECEIDVSLISELKGNQCIGRPIVYLMIDVFTRMILAVGISFDNNSVLGMTNCLLNLADDKVEYCKKYGIPITENMWPSGYLPNRILSDRGSEYMSKEAKRLCNELGITLEPVSAGTGSLKGSVEQWFHQFHSNQNAVLEGHGQISKRHDSNHHKESCLTIDQFTTLLLRYIAYHNTHIIQNYRLEPDMIKQGVTCEPASLWEYGCNKYGLPRKITNIEHYYYSLMLPQKATIDRRGITCNGLFYLNSCDSDLFEEMYTQQNKRGNFDVRIDPRDVGSVYYLRNNKLMRAPLNDMKFANAGFAGLTLFEWKAIQNHLNQQKREGLITALDHKASLEHSNEIIVSNAKKNYPTDISCLAKNRNFDKLFIQNRNSMLLKLCESANSQTHESILPLDESAIYSIESVEDELEAFDTTANSQTLSSENESNAVDAAANLQPSSAEDWLQAIDECNNRNFNP